MTNISGKSKFAQKYSHSYFIANSKKNIYACPLCFDEYQVTEANVLTWDHFPPQSVGGTQKVLVCEQCRRKWDRIDAELDKFKKKEEFIREYPNHCAAKMKLEIAPGLVYRNALKYSDSTMEIKPRLSGDDATNRFSKVISNIYQNKIWNGQKGIIELDRNFLYNQDKIRMAIIKAAYLASFFTFGYPYILSEAISTIRQGLSELNEQHLRFPVTFSPGCNANEKCYVRFSYIYNPEPLKGLGIEIFTSIIQVRWFLIFPIPHIKKIPQYDAQRLGDSALNCIFLEPDNKFICSDDIEVTDKKGHKFRFY